MRAIEGFLKLAAAAFAAVLGGCAVGQTYSYSDTPMAMASVSSSGAVAVAVLDERPYVVSGNKPERFVGLQRGGMGNPFDVNTKSGGPLATEIGDAIVRAMKARGIAATAVAVPLRESGPAARRKLADTRARRSALVTLREWKSDTLMNTDLHYDVTLTVMDEAGRELAAAAIKGSDNLGSLGLVSAAEGVAKASAKKLDDLFADPKVVAALR